MNVIAGRFGRPIYTTETIMDAADIILGKPKSRSHPQYTLLTSGIAVFRKETINTTLNVVSMVI